MSNFNSPDIGAFNLNLLNNSSLYSKNIIAYPSLTKLNVKLYIKNYSGVIATSIFNINGVFLKKVEGDVISLKEFKKGIYILK